MTSQLELRTKPTQARSAATFDHILDTAVVVLEQDGWEGFTTNVLAERAGIGIQTLYRYFPNKLSVVATLAQRVIGEWNEWYADVDQFFSADWEIGAEQAFLLFIEKLKEQPGGVAIRRAMNASHALKELDREDNRRMAERFSVAFFKGLNREPIKDFHFVFLMVIEASLAIIDLVFDSTDKEAKKIIEEFALMQSLFIKAKVHQLGGQA